ncbi:MAG: long-chain fatty acid--CoA ligase [Acidiferrobacterales bacterium]
MQIPINERTNISQVFAARVSDTPEAPAYRQCENGEWVDYTWKDTNREVTRWQQAMKKEGLHAGDRVAVCMSNCFEWVLFDQAAIGLGLITVPLYFGDRPDNMAWCMSDAGVKLLVLESDDIWPQLKGKVETLERVVTLAPLHQDDEKLTSLDDWLPDAAGELAQLDVNGKELATIVYTSGTTGRPKGVMLSHYNILSNVDAGLRIISISASDRFISFLPLSHMFERTVGYYIGVTGGAQTVYARGITELGEDLQQQSPTVMVCVPRIFERINTKMQAGLPPNSLKRTLFEKATDIGWKRFKGTASLMDHLLWPILKALVAKKIHARLGGRIRLIVVGAAALAPELSKIFVGLGLPIIQGYGLTETSPIACANRLDDNDPASVGKPLPEVEIELSGKGEVLIRGPLVMMGYWNNETATQAVIDSDGWFHSGDIGEFRDGRLYITGRAKEIIVMSNGEKLPPGDVEQAIMMDTAFEQLMIIGEGRAKLGMLAVSDIENEKELCDRANAKLKDFPGWVRIHYLKRMSEPWSVENGFMTPTLKLKRASIEKHWAKEIEEIFAGPDLSKT